MLHLLTTDDLGDGEVQAGGPGPRRIHHPRLPAGMKSLTKISKSSIKLIIYIVLQVGMESIRALLLFHPKFFMMVDSQNRWFHDNILRNVLGIKM